MPAHISPGASSPERDFDEKEVTQVHAIVQESDSEPKHESAAVTGNATNDKSIDTDFQAGVQKAEATTIAWSFIALVVHML